MKVYIIGDSFGTEDNIQLYNDLCEESGISFEGSEKFEYRDGFDVALIDFGDISNYDEQNNLEVIRKYYNEGVSIYWYGGFSGCSNRYRGTAMELFPKLKFLHNIEDCPLRDWRWFLNELKEELENDRV